MTASDNPGVGPASSSSALPLWLALAAGIVLLVLMTSQPGEEVGDGTVLGQPLPPLDAAGWLNTERPLTTDDLQGEVVLVDYWASWCGPCRASMPKLIALHQQYRDRGLKVVGLTPETERELPNVRGYVESMAGMDWPIGYDAEPIAQRMGVRGYPTYTLYDRTGKSVRTGHTLDGMDAAIEAALAE